MANCISEIIVKLIKTDPNAVKADMPTNKEVKFDDSLITPELLASIFTGKSPFVDDAAIAQVKKLMGVRGIKFRGVENVHKKFVPKYIELVGNKDRVVAYNIALKELFDSQKSEIDKFNTMKMTHSDLRLEAISDNGIMNVSTARSAAVIGRRFAYTQGFRFSSTKAVKLSPVGIESLYNKLGMAILKQMEAEGVVTFRNGNVLNDVESTKVVTAKAGLVPPLISTQVVVLNMEGIIDKATLDEAPEASRKVEYATNEDLFKAILRGEYSSGFSGKKLPTTIETIIGIVASINHAKIPPMMSVPTLKPLDKEAQAVNDFMKVSTEIETVRDSLHTNPVTINERVVPLLTYLQKQWQRSDSGFEAFIMGQFDSTAAKGSVGLKLDYFHEDLTDSIVGQNRSKVNPLEDLLNLLDNFVDVNENKPKDLHLLYNYIRNARLNMDNSVLNIQGSKLLRPIVGAKKYSIDVNSNPGIVRHLISSILDESKVLGIDFKLDKADPKYSQNLLDVLLGKEGVKNPKLEEYLLIVERAFISDKANGKAQLSALTRLNTNIEGNGFAVLDLVMAISDLRKGLKSGTITTTYNTKPDATASGGSITFGAASGYSEEARTVLAQLGITLQTGVKPEDKLRDIYHILEKRITGYLNSDDTTTLSQAALEKLPELKRFYDVVYKGSGRELSKSPTMTFIYGQGKTSAIASITENAVELLLLDFSTQATREYIAELLGLDKNITKSELLEVPDLKNKLTLKLSEKDGIVKFIYSELDDAVREIIKERRTLINSIYEAIIKATESNSVKILPPAAISSGIKNDAKSRSIYGMPLSKLKNILNSRAKGDLITIEERKNATTATVNTTHAHDNTIAAKAINRGIEKFKRKFPSEPVPGITFVHDEIITDARLNYFIEKEYTKAFKEVISNYSVESQLIEILKQVAPGHSMLETWQKQIAAANDIKQKTLAGVQTDPGIIFGTKKKSYNYTTYGNNETNTEPEEAVETETTTTPEEVTIVPETTTQTAWPDIPFAIRSSAEERMQDNTSKLLANSKQKLKDLLNLTKEEFDTAVEYFGQKGLTRITRNLTANQDYIDFFNGNFNLAQARFEYKDGRVMVPEQLTEAELVKLETTLKSPRLALLMVLSHEVDHKIDFNYFVEYSKASKADKTSKYPELAYIEQTMSDLRSKIGSKLNKNSRAHYALFGNSKSTEVTTSAMLEFAAIMRNEPTIAKELLEAAYPTESRGFIVSTFKSILDAIKKLFSKIVNKETAPMFQSSSKYSNKEKLQLALELASINAGAVKTVPKTNVAAPRAIDPSQYDALPAGFDPNYAYTSRRSPAPEILTGKLVHSLNKITENLITSNAERLAGKSAKAVDTFLNVNFPIYSDVRARVLHLYNDSAISTSLQELAAYMRLSELHNKWDKNELLSRAHNIKEEHNTREHLLLTKMQELTKPYTKENKKVFYDMVTKVPLHNYFRFDIGLDTEAEVSAEIQRLEKTLKSSMSLIDDTVDFLVTRKVKPNSVYNLASSFDLASEQGKAAEKLIALKALKSSGTLELLLDVKKDQPELYVMMKDNSLALYTITNKLSNMYPAGKAFTHTLVKEPYKKKIKFRAITLHDRHLYDVGELTGWKIVKEPEKGVIGVVSKIITDETFTEGASVLNDLPDHDVNVPIHMIDHANLRASNIIKVGKNYKLILTDEERLAAGLNEDMGVALIKSTANAISADSAGYIRNRIMEPSLRSVIKAADDKVVQEIVDTIENDLVDHPWVLKLEPDVKFSDLPKSIQSRYTPITTSLSKLGGFNESITHVRKDIRHWLIGGHLPSLFKNPKIQRMSQILKEMVAGSKIGMIMLSPEKLLTDTISNNLQLAMLGVSSTKIGMYSHDILKDVESFNTLKNSLYELKLINYANPTDESKLLYKRLQNKLKQHSLYTAYTNGFMNSLSSDILNSNIETTEGLQADVHAVIRYFLTDKDGGKNTLHTMISNASRFGMDATGILEHIGTVASGITRSADIKTYFDKVAKNLRRIKNDDDMVNYLAQFTVSPNSEVVKAGTWLNDVTDLVMRETYRRHLLDIGKSPKEAILGAIAVSPDYKEDMPIGLKVLSDYFILKFPSFGFRTVQPTNFLLKKRLASVGIEQYVQSLYGDMETFFHAHPFHKVLDGTLVSHPFESVGLNSFTAIDLV